MALDPCVRSILCGLAQPVLGAIKALVTAQVAVLTAQLGVLEALLLQAQIVNVPIHAAAALAEAARAAINASVSFVPFDLFAGCFDLGSLSVSLRTTLDDTLVGIETVLRDAERALSMEEDIKATIADIQTILLFYNDLLAEISVC